MDVLIHKYMYIPRIFLHCTIGRVHRTTHTVHGMIRNVPIRLFFKLARGPAVWEHVTEKEEGTREREREREDSQR